MDNNNTKKQLEDKQEDKSILIRENNESDDDLYYYTDYECDDKYCFRLKTLEEEQEQLNCSLIALTSHFAQVQLRLKQIVEASTEEKETLLKDLEEFAFRGIPQLVEPSLPSEINDDSSINVAVKLETQRQKQKELIKKLKDQLQDLEQYAYETGQSNVIPSSLLLERQTVIIEQLKGKLPLQLDQLDKLSPEDLRRQVDNAIKELVNPVIMKEQLVSQLKTQVTDLERFIEFLQVGNASKRECTCKCPVHKNGQKSIKKYDYTEADEQKHRNKSKKGKNKSSKKERETLINIMRRVITLLQMFTFVQFGCANISERFERNVLKKTSKGNHWGDLRARLEVAINRILELNKDKSYNDSDYTSDGEQCPYLLFNDKITTFVRKDLCIALRDLIEHGLVQKYADQIGNSLIQFSILNWGCFSSKSSKVDEFNKMTAWDLIIKYYQLKNGPLYNTCPARRLSLSFNLEIVGGMAITAKQTLLSAIDDIIQTHTKLRRSSNSHFKAFVCEALNQRKLVGWLKLILKNQTLVNNYYETWSYTISTGFEDAFRSLEKLSDIKFNLPTDLAVRQLQNINDAFY